MSKQVMTPPGNAGGAGDGGGSNGGDARQGRGPQSMQSVPYAQCEYSEPGPPSLQVLSEAYMHVFKQTGGIEGGAGGDVGGLGGEGGAGGDDGGNGTIASKQMMNPPRTTEESVDQLSRVPAGAALMLAMALKAEVPDMVPGQCPFRAQFAQLVPGAPGAPGQMPGAYPEAVIEFMGGAELVAG